MRWRCHKGRLGLYLAAVGLLILLIILFPYPFLWVLLGLGMIAGGLLLCRR